MLDVHVPHTTHTWKDFLIHVGTICVGLLIAIGLEQTVEAIHRYNERRELQAELHKEGEGNVDSAAGNIELTEHILAWTLAQTVAARRAGPSGPLFLQRMPPATLYFPNTGVFLSAKDNGKIALLPTDQQTWYTDLYRIESRSFGQSTGAYDQFTAAISNLDSVVSDLAVGSSFSTIDISSLSPVQRADFRQRLNQLAGAARGLDRELVYFQTVNQFGLDNDSASIEDKAVIDAYLKARHESMQKHPASRFTLSER